MAGTGEQFTLGERFPMVHIAYIAETGRVLAVGPSHAIALSRVRPEDHDNAVIEPGPGADTPLDGTWEITMPDGTVLQTLFDIENYAKLHPPVPVPAPTQPC